MVKRIKGAKVRIRRIFIYASADTYFGQTQENGISLRVDADNGIMNRIYKNLA